MHVPDAVAEVVDEENAKPNRTNRPSGDDRIFIAFAYAAGPEASAISHHTKSNNPTVATHPVMRCKPDNNIVYPSL